MAHDIFISYSKHDKLMVDAICAALERERIRCWIAPRDVIPGQGWSLEIVRAIEGSKVFLLVFSGNTNTSRHVQREIEIAVNKSVMILPFRIENVEPNGNLEYFISNTHWLDAITQPFQKHIDMLVLAVQHNLSPPANQEAQQNKLIPTENTRSTLEPVSDAEPNVHAQENRRDGVGGHIRRMKSKGIRMIIFSLSATLVITYISYYLYSYFGPTIQLAPAPISSHFTATDDEVRGVKVPKEGLMSAKTFRDCADCPEMVIVPSGKFSIGSGNGFDSEKPMHDVVIYKPFALSRTEITQGQWRALMGNNPSGFQNCGDQCPVETVSWNDAREFVAKLSKKTGKEYRLPSESEWEYACRAGKDFATCGGEAFSVAWFDDNSSRKTHPVGQRLSNAFNLYDMAGNTWEWVEDCWHENYVGATNSSREWIVGCEGDDRVLRGGGWADALRNMRATIRNHNRPDGRYNDVGFRVARMVSP